ncbi:hypothetical protein ACTXT7_009143 [Hymenolepis weldensis]
MAHSRSFKEAETSTLIQNGKESVVSTSNERRLTTAVTSDSPQRCLTSFHLFTLLQFPLMRYKNPFIQTRGSTNQTLSTLVVAPAS